ncbi:unnamed protein product, partial [Brenthis ino]
MLGTKLLLILAPILLVEAQNSLPRASNGFSRRLPLRRPFIRPRPVVTSIPNVPITTEKIEITTVPQPPITHPIEENNIVHDRTVIVPPQSTELTIIYPENYKPATSSQPSSRLRMPVRLTSFQLRPADSNYVAPTTVPPTPPTPSHFNFRPRLYVTSQPAVIPESVKPVDIVAPTESILSQSTEKLPEFLAFESNEPVNKPVPASIEPAAEPTKYIIKPSETEPIEPAPKPLEPVPEPSVTVPEPIKSVPGPIESIPEPIQSVPKPIESVPEPVESVPEPVPELVPTSVPSLETFEPPTPSISMPLNSHPIITEEPAPPATTQQPAIILPPASTTVKPIENRQPEIIPTRPPTIIKPVSVAPSEIPKEISPVDDSIKPFMDDVNPPVSESGPVIIVENNNKPNINWYPAKQKPKPTLAVPSATEIYSYKPTAATNKPIVRPVSTAKPWSQPSVDLYSYVNRLHNYSCRSSDGYESVLNQCDAYVECKQNMAFHNICPDGLHFNPAAKWPEYPCGYPSEVKCESQAVIQKPRPIGQCPHRYGFYPIPDGDCGQYIMCQEGSATIMSCPPGLAFSSITNSCDWPANVPGCNPNIFQGFTCPAPTLDKYGKQINNNSKYRYKNSCNQYIACYKGKPRLLSCDVGTSFDARSGTCIDTDQVVDCQH